MCTLVAVLRSSLKTSEKKVVNMIKFRLFFIAAIFVTLVGLKIFAVETQNQIAYYALCFLGLSQIVFLFYETALAEVIKEKLGNYSGKMLQPIARLFVKIMIKCDGLKNQEVRNMIFVFTMLAFYEVLLYSLLLQVIDGTTIIPVTYIFAALNIIFAAYILGDKIKDYFERERFDTKKWKIILLSSLIFIIVAALLVPAIWYPYSQTSQVIYALFGFALLFVAKGAIGSRSYPYGSDGSDLVFGWALTFAIYSFWLMWTAARFGPPKIF